MKDYPFNPRKLATNKLQFSNDVQMVWVVTCPVCGFEYNHLTENTTQSGNDGYEASWHGRGDLTTLKFDCENGHTWNLCLGFHKGYIFIWYRDDREIDKQEVTP